MPVKRHKLLLTLIVIAAMIAATGYHYIKAGIDAKLTDDVFSRAKK